MQATIHRHDDFPDTIITEPAPLGAEGVLDDDQIEAAWARSLQRTRVEVNSEPRSITAGGLLVIVLIVGAAVLWFAAIGARAVFGS